MKRCPSCKRTYTDASLNFCLEDGTPLVHDSPRVDPHATVRYPAARDTAEPPPTEIYRPESSMPPPPPPPRAPAWSPPPAAATGKSNAVWWVLGGLAVLGVMGIGFVVVLLALSDFGPGNSNTVANRNTNISTNTNENTNVGPTNANSNSDTVPALFEDNFSESKWGAGNFRFGDIWYANDEYHMRSKENTYIVMYAPSEDYRTQDATIKVTARSVDGNVPSAGFGLMFHCAQSKSKQLEDYALLIYPEEEEAKYEVIMHKDGVQSTLISKTTSSAIRSGTNPNQLEVRIKGSEIKFYVNGQFLETLTDTQNFKGGRAGFYTSDTVEVAFDDLEIHRQVP